MKCKLSFLLRKECARPVRVRVSSHAERLNLSRTVNTCTAARCESGRRVEVRLYSVLVFENGKWSEFSPVLRLLCPRPRARANAQYMHYARLLLGPTTGLGAGRRHEFPRPRE